MSMPIEETALQASGYDDSANRVESKLNEIHPNGHYSHEITAPQLPAGIQVGFLLKAQNDLLRTQSAYIHNNADFSALAVAQEKLIEAQSFVLHQLGVV